MSELYRQFFKIYRTYSPLSNYAFSLYLFISKLYDQCISDGVHELFFLAREGEFLKQLYDKYAEQRNGTYQVKTSYLYVSRKAVMLSALNALEDEPFSGLRVYGRMSCLKFLKSLHFEDAEAESLLCDLKLNGENEIEGFFESAEFQRLKASNQFRVLYEEKRKGANQRTRRYLSSVGFLRDEKIGLVDVGWNGTIQHYLGKHRDGKKTVGYYIGIHNNTIFADGEKHGLLFDRKCVFSANHYNYEYLCVADHGTTEGYDDLGKPILKDDNSISLYHTCFSKIQKSITTKFGQIDAIMRMNTLDDDIVDIEKMIEKIHSWMLLSLKKEERVILQAARDEQQDGLAEIVFSRTVKSVIAIQLQNIYLFLHAI